MTVSDIMPSLWFLLAFAFYCVYALSRLGVFLLGCGGAVLAFAPSALGAGIRAQTLTFFAYCFAVGAACLIKSRLPEGGELAVAVTDVDCRGGAVRIGGRTVEARSSDPFCRYSRGQVLAVRGKRS